MKVILITLAVLILALPLAFCVCACILSGMASRKEEEDGNKL